MELVIGNVYNRSGTLRDVTSGMAVALDLCTVRIGFHMLFMWCRKCDVSSRFCNPIHQAALFPSKNT